MIEMLVSKKTIPGKSLHSRRWTRQHDCWKLRDPCFPPDWYIRHRRRGHLKSPAANSARGPDSQIIEGSDGPTSDFPVDATTENNEGFMTFVATTTRGQGMFILDSLSWFGGFPAANDVANRRGFGSPANASSDDEPRRCSLCSWWTRCRQKSDAVSPEYSGVSAVPSSLQSHWFQIAASPYRTIWRFLWNSFKMKVVSSEPVLQRWRHSAK